MELALRVSESFCLNVLNAITGGTCHCAAVPGGTPKVVFQWVRRKKNKKQCSLSGILLGGLLHRKVGTCVWFPSDWRRLRSVRKWHSLKQGAQPRRREKSSWLQPRGAVRGFNTSTTCTQLRSKYAKWSHAALKVVQRRRIVGLAPSDHNFSCVCLFFLPPHLQEP